MSFEFDKNFRRANELMEMIDKVENTLKYTKKSVKRKKHEEHLKILNRLLERTIFKHNQYRLFEFISDAIDKAFEEQAKC